MKTKLSKKPQPRSDEKTAASSPGKPQPQKLTKLSFPIAGIGGSAGSFEAFSRILTALPAKTGNGLRHSAAPRSDFDKFAARNVVQLQ